MHGFAEHVLALGQVAAYLRAMEAKSVLDTGCGTGLGIRFLKEAIPGIHVHGNDPSRALLDVGIEQHGLDPESLDCCVSDALPYTNGQFDAVVETGMLHHVPEPSIVVGEMLRVARSAVFISDLNIFGAGSLPLRAARLALHRAGLLRRVNRRRRGGNDWYYSQGDGIAWDYSIFSSLDQIRAECAQVFVTPTGNEGPLATAFPLAFSSHGLVSAFKEPLATMVTTPPAGGGR